LDDLRAAIERQLKEKVVVKQLEGADSRQNNQVESHAQ